MSQIDGGSDTNKSVEEIIKVQICRRCVYALNTGMKISLSRYQDNSKSCGFCGKNYETPYLIKVKIVGRGIGEIIEMPNNWRVRGKQILAKKK